MAGFLESFRKKILSSLWKEKKEKTEIKDIDAKIALGVLLWGMGAIAEADGKFLPEEEKKIKQILLSYTKISKSDFPIVLTAIRQAGIGKIDFYRCVRQLDKSLPYKVKTSLLEDLFRVAYVDRILGYRELEIIKKVTDLFHVTCKDFEEVKAKIGKEFE